MLIYVSLIISPFLHKKSTANFSQCFWEIKCRILLICQVNTGIIRDFDHISGLSWFIAFSCNSKNTRIIRKPIFCFCYWRCGSCFGGRRQTRCFFLGLVDVSCFHFCLNFMVNKFTLQIWTSSLSRLLHVSWNKLHHSHIQANKTSGLRFISAFNDREDHFEATICLNMIGFVCRNNNWLSGIQ